MIGVMFSWAYNFDSSFKLVKVQTAQIAYCNDILFIFIPTSDAGGMAGVGTTFIVPPCEVKLNLYLPQSRVIIFEISNNFT